MAELLDRGQGDPQNALPALQRAESLLQPIAEARSDSKHLQNIIGDIRAYIEKIESESA